MTTAVPCEVATSIVIEAGRKTFTRALRRPSTLSEVYEWAEGKSRQYGLPRSRLVVSLSGGLARVTF